MTDVAVRVLQFIDLVVLVNLLQPLLLLLALAMTFGHLLLVRGSQAAVHYFGSKMHGLTYFKNLFN